MASTSKAPTIAEVPMIHQGHNIRAYRKMRKLSQTEFGKKLGKDWDQQKVSELESKEAIDEPTLKKAADALEVTVDEIKSYTPEQVTYNIQNNYEGSNVGTNSAAFSNQYCTFNPLDEYKKAMEKNAELYERLLAAEKELSLSRRDNP